MLILKENPPFPVLTNSSKDYNENIKFHIELTDDVKVENNKIIIPATYSLNSKGLQKLITLKEAVCGILVYCSTTFYANFFKFDTNPIRIALSNDIIANKLKFTGLIVAVNELNHPYRDDELNMTYFDSVRFKVPNGGILASDFYGIPPIPLDPAVLDGHISSIFTVCRNNKSIIPEYNLENDCIEILVSNKIYQSYNNLNIFHEGILTDFTLLALVKNALTKAIKLIRNADEDDAITDLLWYRVITYKMSQLGINLDKETDDDIIAEKLFGGNMTEKGLKCIENVLASFMETENE